MNITDKDRAAAKRAVLMATAIDRNRRRLLRAGETVQLSTGVIATLASVDPVARTVLLEGQTVPIPWGVVRWVNNKRLTHVHATFKKKS